jgi:hypothetical protein
VAPWEPHREFRVKVSSKKGMVSMAAIISRRGLLQIGCGTGALGISAIANQFGPGSALAQSGAASDVLREEKTVPTISVGPGIHLFYRDDSLGEPWLNPEPALLIGRRHPFASLPSHVSRDSPDNPYPANFSAALTNSTRLRAIRALLLRPSLHSIRQIGTRSCSAVLVRSSAASSRERASMRASK